MLRQGIRLKKKSLWLQKFDLQLSLKLYVNKDIRMAKENTFFFKLTIPVHNIIKRKKNQDCAIYIYIYTHTL